MSVRCCTYSGGVERRFEFRCSGADLEAFAKAAGREPVGRWARRVLRSVAQGAGEGGLAERVEGRPVGRAAPGGVGDAVLLPPVSKAFWSGPTARSASPSSPGTPGTGYCAKTGLFPHECLCPNCKGAR